MNKIKKNIKNDYLYRFFSSFDITSAIWVLYLGYKGMNLAQIGLLEGIFHITGFLSEMPTGALADWNFFISYVVAIIIGISSLTISFNFTEVQVIDGYQERITVVDHFKNSISILKGNKKLLNILIFFPIIYTFSAIIYFYGQQFLSDMGYSRISISIIFLFNGVVSALGAILSDRIYKRYKSLGWVLITVIISLLIISMGCVTKGLLHSVYKEIDIVWGWLGVYDGARNIIFISFLTAILQPISSKLINSMVESKQRATIISVESMFYSLMMIILFPICGLIADKFSLYVSFKIIGVIGVVITSIEMVSIRKK